VPGENRVARESLLGLSCVAGAEKLILLGGTPPAAKAATHLIVLMARLKAAPFQNSGCERVFQQPASSKSYSSEIVEDRRKNRQYRILPLLNIVT
jgi:hypothetical protein